jgi:hypothetical protein
MFARWERIVTTQAIDRMDDIRACPRCNMSVIIDVKAQFGHCTKCFFAFCVLCGSAYHPGTPCQGKEAQLLKMVEKGPNADAETMLRRLRLEQELLTIQVRARVCVCLC